MENAEWLLAAYATARRDLLTERTEAGHWVGELASSALSTATAVSALALVERGLIMAAADSLLDKPAVAPAQQVATTSQIGRLIVEGVRWLVGQQNADGGWGDTDKSRSNIATTMLVRAAFALTGLPSSSPEVLERADRYIAAQGGVAGVRRRYGRDKTFAAPILTTCALADLVPWRDVPALPFELACLPQRFWKLVRLPVVSYAIPALVAIGQVRHHFRKPWNPLTRLIRRACIEKSLRVLEEKQPASGGFLEATPLTSFVVMSLAGIGRADHPVARLGVEFLRASVRADGSWPIDTNLATWNTTLAVSALAQDAWALGELDCLDWILSCQHRQVHPFTGAAPGGWAWTDLTGGVPDADDTAGALLAIKHLLPHATSDAQRQQVREAARAGVGWLVDLQNRDGGWPTFCRGWGTLPFDRSGADLTAHALRALSAWQADVREPQIAKAVERGFRYLEAAQQHDGSWIPLWFGNHLWHDETNPIYGTARVLLAYRDLDRLDGEAAQRGLDFLVASQHADGGWGGPPNAPDKDSARGATSVEETALAVETLHTCGTSAAHENAAEQGLKWLISAVEANKHRETSPIGFYFAKLWYYERLYPLIYVTAALGQAVRRTPPQPAASVAIKIA